MKYTCKHKKGVCHAYVASFHFFGTKMSDFAPKEGNRPNSHFFKEKVVFLLQKHVQTPNNPLQYHFSNCITYNKERAYL